MNRRDLTVLSGVLVLCACSETRDPQAPEAVMGSVPERREEPPARPAPEAVPKVEEPREEAGPSWVPVDDPDVPSRVIVIRREIRFGDLARELGTTVEELNAINGLQLAPETLLARGSELYVSRFIPIA